MNVCSFSRRCRRAIGLKRSRVLRLTSAAAAGNSDGRAKLRKPVLGLIGAGRQLVNHLRPFLRETKQRALI